MQPTAHEPYRLSFKDGSYTLWAEVAGEWKGLYVFDLMVQARIDYEIGNWYVCTHPDSSFVGHLKAALIGPGFRRTLQNANYAIHYLDRPSDKRTLSDVDELLALLQDSFGIRLPQHPHLRPALVQLLANGQES